MLLPRSGEVDKIRWRRSLGRDRQLVAAGFAGIVGELNCLISCNLNCIIDKDREDEKH